MGQQRPDSSVPVGLSGGKIAMDQSASSGGTDSGQPSSMSSSLLDRVKVRDPEAWRRLVRLYGPVVYGWCRKLGLQRADAANVVQETFLAVSASVENFRHERPGDSFRGWLWSITRNKVRDQFRQRQGQEVAPGGSEAQQQMAQIPDRPPESVLSAGQSFPDNSPAHRALEQIRAEFEPKTWEAFWRTTVDRQPAVEVGVDLGITRASVYMAKSRVMRRIRQELGDLFA